MGTAEQRVAASRPRPKVKDPLVCPLTTNELVDNVLRICEVLNGVEFYAYQQVFARRIVRSLLLNDGAIITGLFSRQCGKSEVLACLGSGICVVLPWLALSFKHDERLNTYQNGVLLGVFAPKKELSFPIYQKIRDRTESDRGRSILAEAGVEISTSRGDSMTFSNGSFVKAQTASEQTMNEGATYHAIFIDEAQRVSRSKVSKEIAPMLSSTNGTMVKIGTAWQSKGGFHNDIRVNISIEKRGGPRNHFEFDYERVITEKRALYSRQEREFSSGVRETPPGLFHLRYEKWVQGELARLGGSKDSEEFRMNFRLMWQESRSIAISEQLLNSLALRNEEANIPKHFGVQVAGIDVAKESDSTVVTVAEIFTHNPLYDPQTGETYFTKKILGWKELQGSFEKLQYDGIVDFLRLYNVRRVNVDATGMGDPVCERLQVKLAVLGIEVLPFKYTTMSKSDLYKYYLQELSARRVLYPAGDETAETPEYKNFYEQHKGLEREWTGAYLSCSAPEGEHDDYPDSGALAILASKGIHEEIPVMDVSDQVGANPGAGDHIEEVNDGSRSSRYLRGRRR